jgi:hypothetical protein
MAGLGQNQQTGNQLTGFGFVTLVQEATVRFWFGNEVTSRRQG